MRSIAQHSQGWEQHRNRLISIRFDHLHLYQELDGPFDFIKVEQGQQGTLELELNWNSGHVSFSRIQATANRTTLILARKSANLILQRKVLFRVAPPVPNNVVAWIYAGDHVPPRVLSNSSILP